MDIHESLASKTVLLHVVKPIHEVIMWSHYVPPSCKFMDCKGRVQYLSKMLYTAHGKILVAEKFWELYYWRTKICAYAKYIFGVSVNIDEANGSWLASRQFFPTKIFPCTVIQHNASCACRQSPRHGYKLIIDLLVN